MTPHNTLILEMVNDVQMLTFVHCCFLRHSQYLFSSLTVTTVQNARAKVTRSCLHQMKQEAKQLQKCHMEHNTRNTHNHFTAIIEINMFLSEQSFTARMPFLAATSTFGLGRRHPPSSPQLYYRDECR